MVALLHGTGSYPPGSRGWQRLMRLRAIQLPFNRPYFRASDEAALPRPALRSADSKWQFGALSRGFVDNQKPAHVLTPQLLIRV
jgi:hypothetical protein